MAIALPRLPSPPENGRYDPENDAQYRAAVERILRQLNATGLTLGTSEAATTPGTVVGKVEIFDSAGASLGFIALYDAIT